jgi:nucleotide-binding universal stress UspA family protein
MRSHLALALVPDDIEASGALATPGMPTLADQEDVDVLVVGSRGYGPIRRLMLGSVSTASCEARPAP